MDYNDYDNSSYYGIPDEDISAPYYGAAGPSGSSGGYFEERDLIDEMIEEIENSTPSPPERHPYNHSNPQPLRDDISDYDEDDPSQLLPQQHGYQDTQLRFNQQTVHRPAFESSLSRPPLRPFATPSTMFRPTTNRGPSGFQTTGSSTTSFGHFPCAPTTQTSAPVPFTPTSRPNVTEFEHRSHPNRVMPAQQQGPGGIRLRPVSALPDMYRSLFKFGVFNAIQSSCYETIMESEENLVVSAPTGSGKTVLFELAMLRLFITFGQTSSVKCVYMAPTKALCSERHKDWVTKFEPIGIKCCELTGDTVHFGKSAWGDAKHANIIVTTCEKWDSLTRSWRDHGQILSQIQLCLVDEVHILNESRGSTLEVVISRMKARGSAVRFVSVSATVPNIDDVARWIGSKHASGPARVFQFGEEFRPCKLTRHVYGFPKKQNMNDFQFAYMLDNKLFPILQRHSSQKPTLVFCATRKGVQTTAETMLKEYQKAREAKQSLPWQVPRRVDATFLDQQLAKLAELGIGVHHAGINPTDRKTVEDLFLNKTLKVLVATSTLAVGVNLPAHLVVIKGVKLFQNNACVEYSDLDMMQMIGRAGRPQFDKDGVAVIMCESELEYKYTNLASGQTILESSLHLNLAEHINAEVGLGTINSTQSAKAWIHNSFLYQRILKNPKHYHVTPVGVEGGDAKAAGVAEIVDSMVVRTVDNLKKAELLMDGDGEDELVASEYGDVMSKFYIRQATMAMIIKLGEKASLRDMLEAISSAEELSDLKLRSGEKGVYRKLREQDEIRFRIPKVEKTSDKIFILIQAILGGVSLNSPEFKSSDSQPYMESLSVFRHIGRIARAIVEVGLSKQSGAQIKHGLELLRILSGKAWDDRAVIFRQIDKLGDKSIKVLAENGIATFDALRKVDPLRIEVLLNRKPGFGHHVLSKVAELPRYFLNIQELKVSSSQGDGPVEVEIAVECGLAAECTFGATKSKRSKGAPAFDMTAVVTTTSPDLDYVDFRRIPTKALKDKKSFTITAKLTKPSQSVQVCISSENVAGVSLTKSFRPKVDSRQFPVMDTRPRNAVDMTLEGLEDDPNFWNDMDEEEELPAVTAVDLTASKSTKGQPRSADKAKQKRLVDNSRTSTDDERDHSPKKLANGKYACNHSCKDKTSCRHMCCRDGLDKPPNQSKKSAQSHISGEKSTSAKAQKNTTSIDKGKDKDQGQGWRKPKPKTTTASSTKKSPSSRNLQDLESLHEKTGVASNLNLAKGKRIKLDQSFDDHLEPPSSARSASALISASTSAPAPALSSKTRKRAQPPRPSFDLEFTDLGDKDATEAQGLDLSAQESDVDDELPDIHSLIQSCTQKPKKFSTTKESSPSTNYDDTEIDAIIAETNFDDVLDLTALHSSPVHETSLTLSSNPTPQRKRKTQPVSQDPVSKRSKLSHPPVAALSTLEAASPKKTGRYTEPLFLPDDDDEEAIDQLLPSPPSKRSSPQPSNTGATATHPTKMDLDEDEGFVLDESLFDVIDEPRSQSSPTMPPSNYSSFIDNFGKEGNVDMVWKGSLADSITQAKGGEGRTQGDGSRPRISLFKSNAPTPARNSFFSNFRQNAAPAASTKAERELPRSYFTSSISKPAQDSRPFAIPSFPVPSSSPPKPKLKVVDTSIPPPMDDPLAEFEAFLASGAVQFVDKLE